MPDQFNTPRLVSGPLRARWRTCYRKVQHATKADAELHLAYARGDPAHKHPDRLKVYRCDYCRHWHVGKERSR